MLLHNIKIDELEKFVGKRFYSIEELSEEIDSVLGSEGLTLNESWKNNEEDDCDFELNGSTMNEEIDENDDIEIIEQYDITIYYTKSKNHFYITETSYESL